MIHSDSARIIAEAEEELSKGPEILSVLDALEKEDNQQTKVRLEEVLERVYHVNFPTQRALASTFLRFQEHYESPEFRGKVFSLEEFKQWYIANSPKGKETGEFTYYEDWFGFNIPSSVLQRFYGGAFDPLSDEESTLLSLFQEKESPFYVIGTFGDKNTTTLQHEVAHGLFYVQPEYKQAALNIITGMDQEERKKLRECLTKLGGYHPDVLDDETQAHLLSNIEDLLEADIVTGKVRETHEQLRAEFGKYHRE